MYRSIFTILFVLVSLLAGGEAAAAQTCTAAPVGLISNWSGDGNALDARSRYNGTIQNGITYTAGKVGQAFNLAGNNGDRVLLGTTPDLQRQNFTIEGWIKRASSSIVTNSPNPGGPAGVFFAFGSGGYALLIQQSTGKLGLSQVQQSQVLSPNLTITDTNWHHIAVTVSGPPFSATTTATFYVDGVADTPVNYSPQYSFSTNAAIGARGDGQTDQVFFGAIDEFAIYDRPLAAAQIAAIYAADTAGKCKPLATNAPDNQVLWLAGDGDLLDGSGYGHNGTPVGNATFAAGKVGRALQFDGTVPSTVTVADTQALRPLNAVTVEGWINPSASATGFQAVVFKGNTSSAGGQPYSLFVNGANHQLVVRVGNDSTFQAVGSTGGIPTGVFSHVAFTYDGANVRIFINGVLDSTTPSSVGTLAQTDTNVLRVGGIGSFGFTGSLDELGVFSRALSAAEIGSIANAGLAGKLKLQATVPAGIAAWYPGDGNASDLQAGNTATAQGTATYANGKVGRAFSVSPTGYFSAPSTVANDPSGTTGATMEAWIYLNQRPSDAGRPFFILSKDGPTFGAADAFHLRIDTDNGIKFQWQAGGAGPSSNFTLQTGAWYHVAGTYTPGEPCRFYINGVFQSTGSCTATPRTPSNQPLEIGRYSGTSGGNFDGLIDEPAVYSRALTEAEIRDQYLAGANGKYKGSSNPTAGNTVIAGNATVTFGTLTTAGAVNFTPLDAAALPVLPLGSNTGVSFDVSTSAVYANPTVCLNMSGYSPAQFANLRLYHLESGVWQNRTFVGSVYPNLCTSGLTSLSPFAVALVTPTAAASSISGAVTTGKSGLANVVVTISGGNLAAPRSVKTNSFGAYRFDGLDVGQLYTISVASKKYSFEPSSMTVDMVDEITNADFRATSR